ncbi:MAG: hypothetical protein H6684_07705 [Deltaproteobacteria bacterium]|nr:hypothetical protein [Deltaproteobacteria bacterium]
MKRISHALVIAVMTLLTTTAFADDVAGDLLFRLRVRAPEVADRAALARFGSHLQPVAGRDGWFDVVVNAATGQAIGRAGFATAQMTLLDLPGELSYFHEEDEIGDALDGWAEDYPDWVDVSSIGTTADERPIRLIKIGDKTETGEGGLLLTATTHAREYITTEVALEFARRVLEDAANDEDGFARWLIENREIFIVPSANPDGHQYDMDQGLVYWRKNRSETSLEDCPGVDINRNFPVDFGGEGASDEVCDELYHGASALSEIEAQALVQLIDDNPNLHVAVDLHSFGGLVLYPYGYRALGIEDANDGTTHALAGSLIGSELGYASQTSYQLYPISGGMIDYLYDHFGMLSLLIELTTSTEGFYPAESVFDPLFAKTDAALYLAAALGDDPDEVQTAGLWKSELSVTEGGAVRVAWWPYAGGPWGTWSILRDDGDGEYAQVAGPINAGQNSYDYDDNGVEAGATYRYRIRYSGTYGERDFLDETITLPGDDDDDDSGDDDSDDDATGDDGVRPIADADDDDDTAPGGVRSAESNDDGGGCGI